MLFLAVFCFITIGCLIARLYCTNLDKVVSPVLVDVTTDSSDDWHPYIYKKSLNILATISAYPRMSPSLAKKLQKDGLFDKHFNEIKPSDENGLNATEGVPDRCQILMAPDTAVYARFGLLIIAFSLCTWMYAFCAGLIRDVYGCVTCFIDYSKSKTKKKEEKSE
jgi:hypothetical protein